MNPIEIVALIKEANPKLLGKMPDARAAKIVASAFREVGKQLEATEQGKVKIAGLGAFTVRQVEREKDGQMVTVKKIGYRGVKLKAKADAE